MVQVFTPQEEQFSIAGLGCPPTSLRSKDLRESQLDEYITLLPYPALPLGGFETLLVGNLHVD